MNCSQWVVYTLKSAKYFAIQYFEILCRHIIYSTHSRCGMYKIKCRNEPNQFDFLKTDICFRHATARIKFTSPSINSKGWLLLTFFISIKFF